jgi:hypothetical protein
MDSYGCITVTTVPITTNGCNECGIELILIINTHTVVEKAWPSQIVK